jgi:protein-disulfide isomerase
MRLRLILALLVVSAASAQPKSALDKKTLEAYIRHLIPYPQQVSVVVSDPRPSELPGYQLVTVHASLGNASEDKVFYVSPDGQKLFQTRVFDIVKNPFQREMDMLKTELQPSMGTPGAPVVIVLFSDFQCTYCREEALTLRQELLKAFPTQVRLYFKDFPLTTIHPWAKSAAITGRCIFQEKPSAFWQYFDWAFENQPSITPENFREKSLEFAGGQGLDADKLTSCADAPAAVAEVERSMAEGGALGVNSTPTIFLNGRPIPGAIKWENLRQLIEAELGYQATAQNAGEECCTVTIPNPLNMGK